MGLERIILSLEKSGFSFSEEDNLEVLIIPIGAEALQVSIEMMQNLHRADISAIVADESSSIGSNLKYCDKNNVSFAILIGDNELKSGLYVLKNIKKKSQSEVKKEEVLDFIKTS